MLFIRGGLVKDLRTTEKFLKRSTSERRGQVKYENIIYKVF